MVIKTGVFRKGVFIVVYTNDKGKIKYLLLKRKLHWKGWEFPKGGIKKGEGILKAVKRELKEETGINPVKIIEYKFKGRYKYPKKISDRKEFIGQTFQLYSAETKNKKIKLDKREHSQYKWVGFKEAVKMLTWKNQKKSLEVVNHAISKKRIRKI